MKDSDTSQDSSFQETARKRAIASIASANNSNNYAYVEFEDLSSIPEEIKSLSDKRCYLTFKRCSMGGIRHLLNLPDIRSISFENCRNIEYNILPRIKSLTSISFVSESFDELSFLVEMLRLTSISFQRCTFHDTEYFAKLPKLARVNLSYSSTHDLSDLAKCKNLSSVNLKGASAELPFDLGTLKKLNSLNLSNTKFENIDFIGELKSLRILRLDNMEATSLPSLSKCKHIFYMSCADTRVNKLDFLKELRFLDTLNISGTEVDNLSPLRNLNSLTELYAARCPITDLSPISGLFKIKRLDISDTSVTELSPISELTLLARGPRGGRTGGLFFAGSPISDSALREMAPLRKADRAEQVISYLRNQQGLRPLWGPIEPKETVPAIPSQEAGPHFTISDSGSIDFEIPSQIDEAGNNIGRLRAFHPKLVQLARDLVSLLSPNEQPHLLRAATNYLNAVSPTIDNINFDILYGEGLFLEEASLASERDLVARLAPALEDAPVASLNTLLHLHGIFILSTKSGQDNIELAQKYDSNPRSEALKNEALAELAGALRADSEVASQKVIAYVSDMAAQSDQSKVERQQSFKASTVKNFAIVLTAGASIAALPKAGIAVSGALAAGAGYVALEGLKKSAPFLAVSGLIKGGIDHISEVEAVEFARRVKDDGLNRYLQFIEKNEDTFRKIASVYGKVKWLEDHLDWIREVREAAEAGD